MNIVSLIHVANSEVRNLSKKTKKVQLHESALPGEYFVSDYSLRHLKVKKIPFHLIHSFTEKELPLQVSYPSQSSLFEPPNRDALHEAMAYAMSQRKGNKKSQILYLGRRSDSSLGSFALDRPGGNRSYQWKVLKSPHKIRDFRDNFRRIKQKVKDRDTKVILSLGSGGVRLFAHTSLMKFIDLLGLRPHISEIWGSSGGAIAGLPYSLGIDPEEIDLEGYHLYNERYSFRFSPSRLEVLKNIIVDSLLTDSENSLKGFMDCQSSLRLLLERHMAPKKKKIPFFCLAYNLEERRNEILTPEKIDPNDYHLPIIHTDALDAVIASSSIPIIYVPKKIFRGETEHLYIDGGTTEEVPLISPFRKWTQDRLSKREKRKKLLIIAVNLFPQVGMSRLFTHWIFKKLPPFRILQLSATYADIIRQARIDEHKGHLTRQKNVTLWELTLPLKGGGILNTKIIPQVLETAKRSFYKQLVEIEKHL